MGRIQIGDELFDEAGRVCSVLAKFSPPVNQAYRIEFSDGSHIVADEDHQWVTWTHRDRKQFLRTGATEFPDNWPKYQGAIGNRWGHVKGFFGPSTRTTQQIKESSHIGSRLDSNHSIPLSEPLDLPTRDLILDPWLLGYWLGNGSLGRGEITSGSPDGDLDSEFVCSKLDLLGILYSCREYPEYGQSRFNLRNFVPILESAGVLHERRIPTEYLRSSISQRQELTRGLMDSDGYADRDSSSKVEFCSIIKELAESVLELIISLGEKGYLVEDRARLDGRDCGPRFRVFWRPSLFNPFSLPRKKDRVDISTVKPLHRQRMICAVIPVDDPGPMSCITVSSSNSMYLAGKSMIPTHNTRTGAEFIRAEVDAGRMHRIALIAETSADARDVMVEGNSGILHLGPPEKRPLYEPSKRRLTWPNGAVATLFNAVEPEQLRGPQFDGFWADELAKWRYAQETWDQLQFGMRLGDHPRGIITTTPRPLSLVKCLIEDSKGDNPRVFLTRGRTIDNVSNLAPEFISSIRDRYAGTRLGRQELDAEVLEDTPGGLWQRSMFERPGFRVEEPPHMRRIVVAVDPSGARSLDDEGADEIGIIVAGIGLDHRFYVLRDLSLRASPRQWAQVAVDAYHDFKADRLIAERNFGGAMVEETIRRVDNSISYKEVVASRSKLVRAEPVAALYEQGRVSHVTNVDSDMSILEDQLVCMTSDGYTGEGSPDHLDACVWALTELSQRPVMKVSKELLERSSQPASYGVQKARTFISSALLQRSGDRSNYR